MGVQTYFQVPIREGLKIVSAANQMQNGLGKSADYTMSHVTGKIRILGEDNGKTLFQYKQAKEPADANRIFHYALSEEDAWLPDNFKA